jgi:hypothetical protein
MRERQRERNQRPTKQGSTGGQGKHTTTTAQPMSVTGRDGLAGASTMGTRLVSLILVPIALNHET